MTNKPDLKAELYGNVWTSTETVTDIHGKQWTRATRSLYRPVTWIELIIFLLGIGACVGWLFYVSY